MHDFTPAQRVSFEAWGLEQGLDMRKNDNGLYHLSATRIALNIWRAGYESGHYEGYGKMHVTISALREIEEGRSHPRYIAREVLGRMGKLRVKQGEKS